MTTKFNKLKNKRRLGTNITKSIKLVLAALKKKQKYSNFFKIARKSISSLKNIKTSYKDKRQNQKQNLYQLSLTRKQANQSKVYNRLDFILYKVFFFHSVSTARAAIRNGLVQVNKKVIRFYNYRLKSQDFVLANCSFCKQKSVILYYPFNIKLSLSFPLDYEVSFATIAFVKCFLFI